MDADIREELHRAYEASDTRSIERLLRHMLLRLREGRAQAVDTAVLHIACEFRHNSLVCAIVATGAVMPTDELHVKTLEQLILSPALTLVARVTRQEAVRVASRWPGHKEALAQLAELIPHAPNVWNAVYAETETDESGALTAVAAQAKLITDMLRACEAGDVPALDRLIAGGLEDEHARAECNQALISACEHGHLEIIKRLLALGLTAEDVWTFYNHALRVACLNGHNSVVCALVATGLVKMSDTDPLHAMTLLGILREPDTSADSVALRVELHRDRREAARVAAGWPGHEAVSAQLANDHPECVAAWRELYPSSSIGEPLASADDV